MTQIIEVIVSPTGETKIETKGFAGAAPDVWTHEHRRERRHCRSNKFRGCGRPARNAFLVSPSASKLLSAALLEHCGPGKSTTTRSNFLYNLGYGDPAKLLPRNPRLSFDEACQTL